jgi:hypothetical protein
VFPDERNSDDLNVDRKLDDTLGAEDYGGRTASLHTICFSYTKLLPSPSSPTTCSTQCPTATTRP